MKANVRAGTTYLYDLKHDPRYVIEKPYHSLHFYLPRSALDGIAEQTGAPRVGELAYQFGVGHDDDGHPSYRCVAAKPRCAGRPRPTSFFIDHMMLAFTAHVAQTYGGLRRIAGSGSWRPCSVAGEARMREAGVRSRRKLSLQQIAADFGLSVSHFSRAFRISIGLPPHQWLLRQRVRVAKQLMTVRDLPLSEIAISAGLCQSKPLHAGLLGRGRRESRSVAPRDVWRAGRQGVIHGS